MNFKNPDEFRHSKKWGKFANVLKLERTNDNGVIICEYCGKPITKKYDCIAHHKIELTCENVNDAEISLNPENVLLIHLSCHNLIHERFCGFKQKVYVVYGSPCSGKSTYVNSIAKKDDLILDIDRIWECLCNSNRYEKPCRIKSNVFGVFEIVLEQIKMRKGKWRNAFIVGGFPLSSERDRLSKILNAELIFIDEKKEVCLSRCVNDDWKQYVNNWFEDYTE